MHTREKMHTTCPKLCGQAVWVLLVWVCFQFSLVLIKGNQNIIASKDILTTVWFQLGDGRLEKGVSFFNMTRSACTNYALEELDRASQNPELIPIPAPLGRSGTQTAARVCFLSKRYFRLVGHIRPVIILFID